MYGDRDGGQSSWRLFVQAGTLRPALITIKRFSQRTFLRFLFNHPKVFLFCIKVYSECHNMKGTWTKLIKLLFLLKKTEEEIEELIRNWYQFLVDIYLLSSTVYEGFLTSVNDKPGNYFYIINREMMSQSFPNIFDKINKSEKTSGWNQLFPWYFLNKGIKNVLTLWRLKSPELEMWKRGQPPYWNKKHF